MNKYKVYLQESLQNEYSDEIVFECMADDEDHVQEQVVDAYFGCVIHSIEKVSPKLIIHVDGGCVSYFHDVPDLEVLVLDYDDDCEPEIPFEFMALAKKARII